MGATNTTCSKSDCFVRPIKVEMDLHKARQRISALDFMGAMLHCMEEIHLCSCKSLLCSIGV